jgi:hypothetical protein
VIQAACRPLKHILSDMHEIPALDHGVCASDNMYYYVNRRL